MPVVSREETKARALGAGDQLRDPALAPEGRAIGVRRPRYTRLREAALTPRRERGV